MPDTSLSRDKIDVKQTAYLLITIIATVTILEFSEKYIIPFILAMIVWFIIHELRENIQQVPFFRKHMPMWMQSMMGFIIICVVLYVVGQLLIASISSLMANIGEYEVNLDIALFQLSSFFQVDVKAMLSGLNSDTDITQTVTQAVDYASYVLGDVFLILLYVLFLLIEESIFPQKLNKLYGSKTKFDKSQKLFQKMDKNISKYLTLKTFVSFLTGLFSYFAFLVFDLDAPIFWAMLIFVLNYIPTIGSLIATLFPAVFSILQFGEFETALYILIIVGFIQVIIGNVLEPKIMGNSLNISSLVVVLSLTIWGAIWGVIGMILSVPITVMMIIVFEEIPGLRPIAIMLSERGDLNVEEDLGTSAGLSKETEPSI